MAAQNARARILRQAEIIFAGKGYHGAGVDELARAAGVPKSLLYYHFKSKEGVLRALLEEFKAALLEFISKMQSLPDKKTGAPDLYRYTEAYLEFYAEKKLILKIILSESLREGGSAPFLFDIGELFLTDEVKKIYKERNRTRSKPLEPEAKKAILSSFKVFEFFTGILPLFTFTVYGDWWADHFGMTKEDLRKWFLAAYRDTHLQAHQTLQNSEEA